MTGHSGHTANAFASTFYFFADTQINAKKIERACKPKHYYPITKYEINRLAKELGHNSDFPQLRHNYYI
jgi:hypothetical protein